MSFQSQFQWNLYGSEGRTALGGNFHKLLRKEDGRGLIAGEMHISATWLDRTADRISFSELRKEFSVAFYQLTMRVDDLTDLVARLGVWLEFKAPFSIVISSAEDQNLSFYLGPPRDAKRLAEAVFEIEYSGIDFPKGKWLFAVDQSCVRIFMDELNVSMANLSSGGDSKFLWSKG